MEVNDVVGSYSTEYVANNTANQAQTQEVQQNQTNEENQYQESGKGQVVDYEA